MRSLRLCLRISEVAQLRVPPHFHGGRVQRAGWACCWTTTPGTGWATCWHEGDFYRHEHQLIFAAIGKLINDSKPADVITVFEHLQGMGKAEEVGGLLYLNQLAQYVPSATNIRRYAEIVRERAILRKLVTASDEIATNAFNPQGKPVERILDEAEQKILAIGEEGSRMKQGFQSHGYAGGGPAGPRAGDGRQPHGRDRRAHGLCRSGSHDHAACRRATWWCWRRAPPWARPRSP